MKISYYGVNGKPYETIVDNINFSLREDGSVFVSWIEDGVTFSIPLIGVIALDGQPISEAIRQVFEAI